MVKRVGSDAPDSHDDSLGQFTWSKHGGPTAAWEKAKKAAFWPFSHI